MYNQYQSQMITSISSIYNPSLLKMKLKPKSVENIKNINISNMSADHTSIPFRQRLCRGSYIDPIGNIWIFHQNYERPHLWILHITNNGNNVHFYAAQAQFDTARNRSFVLTHDSNQYQIEWYFGPNTITFTKLNPNQSRSPYVARFEAISFTVQFYDAQWVCHLF